MTESSIMNICIKNNLYLLILGIGYCFGVLSFQHYSPSQHDFYINSICYILVAFALVLFFIKNKTRLYINNIFWLFVLCVFLIQPFINKIIYTDSLIFPIAIILLITLVSISISNYDNKRRVIYFFGYIFILSSLLLFLTQLIHILKILPLVELMRLPLQVQRFSGNIFQPNQAAFIFSLGIISSMFIFDENKKVFNYICIFILSVGIAFTASRSGLIILLSMTLFFNLYKNYDKKNSLLKIYEFYFALMSFIIGNYYYNKLAVNGIVGRISQSLDDPRLSLLSQSWLSFVNQPLTGIGWKNFASSNFIYYNQLEWVSFTDHSHFIIGQLLAEFGVLGGLIFILFTYIVIKNLKKLKNIQDIFVFTILCIFILYSCFEYPLWYFRYLFVFSIFLSLLDKSEAYEYKVDKDYLIYVPCLFLMISSVYYTMQYRKVAYINDIVFDQNENQRNKMLATVNLDPIFGFSYFQDLLFFEAADRDEFLLNDKLIIGERLVEYSPDYRFLIKQGAFLAFDNQKEKSLLYFDMACHYDFYQKCPYTIQVLTLLNNENHKKFGDIYYKVNTHYNSQISKK
ncbi:O-antigen ligase family protein [Acinetobacter sp. ULE_I010]|uniref:O-antigen ligase family protein n=1 Tax=Acinetobacter sp. ULE_I010 TaxID=3373065 RepID=UPI003AF64FC4